jgi:hypothetical protein
MPTDADTEPEPTATDRDRYRYVQYDDGGGTVYVLQDTENHRAWIQSTLSVAVER